MKICGPFTQTQQDKITEVTQIQAKGRFYSITRHYAIQDETNKEVYDVALNFFERIKKTVIELFGGNYFKKLSPFKDKKIILLSSKEAGLPVKPGAPATTRSPVGSSIKTTTTLPPSSTPPKIPKEESDQRIITRFISPSYEIAKTPVSETQKIATEVLTLISEGLELYKKNPAEKDPSLDPHEYPVRLSTVNTRPGFESIDQTRLDMALNYLLLSGKIGYYRGARGDTTVVSIDPAVTMPNPAKESSMKLYNKQKLLDIDTYMTLHTKTIKDLEPIDPKLLDQEGNPNPALLDLLSEINQKRFVDATNPSTHTLSTKLPNEKIYLDFLLAREVISGWAKSTSFLMVFLEDPTKLPPSKTFLWRTGNDVKREDDFRKAHTILLDAPPTNFSPDELNALHSCVDRLNERVSRGESRHVFKSFQEGKKVVDFLKSQKKIVDYTYIPSSPTNFILYVTEEDRPKSAP
jgi:hypothetical protein